MNDNDDIEEYLTFADLQTELPQTINIGIVSKKRLNFVSFFPKFSYNKPLSNEELQLFIAEMRQKGYNAVAIDDPASADPATLRISPTGIRSPFIEAEDIKDSIKTIVEDINSSQYVRVLSYPQTKSLENYGDIVDMDAYQTPKFLSYHGKKFFRKYYHPYPQTLEDIFAKYGNTFIDDMVEYAYQHRISSKWLKKLKYQKGEENYLFNGTSFTKKEYVHNPFNNLEGRSAIYASPRFKVAKKFSGIQFFDGKDKNKAFSFIRVYAGNDNQKYVVNYGMESGAKTTNKRLYVFETNITSSNPYLYTMMIFDNAETYFLIDENDPKWRDFKEIFRIGFMPLNEYDLANYQAKIQQDDEYGKVTCYDIYGRNITNDTVQTQLPQKDNEINNQQSSIQKLREKAQGLTGQTIEDIYADDMNTFTTNNERNFVKPAIDLSRFNIADLVSAVRQFKQQDIKTSATEDTSFKPRNQISSKDNSSSR